MLRPKIQPHLAARLRGTPRAQPELSLQALAFALADFPWRCLLAFPFHALLYARCFCVQVFLMAIAPWASSHCNAWSLSSQASCCPYNLSRCTAGKHARQPKGRPPPSSWPRHLCLATHAAGQFCCWRARSTADCSVWRRGRALLLLSWSRVACAPAMSPALTKALSSRSKLSVPGCTPCATMYSSTPLAAWGCSVMEWGKIQGPTCHRTLPLYIYSSCELPSSATGLQHKAVQLCTQVAVSCFPQPLGCSTRQRSFVCR